MPAEPLQGTGEPAEAETDDEERHAEPDRVDGEQPSALRHTPIPRGDPEDGGKDRPDARRPAEAERRAGDRGGERAEAGKVRVEPGLTEEPGRLDDERRTEDERHGEDDPARDPGEEYLVMRERQADRGRDEPEQREHHTETRHEQ